MTTLLDTELSTLNLYKTAFEETKKRRTSRNPSHVMVVEDDALTRRLLVCILGEKNALITEENAKSAVVSYLLHAPDIVFLDIGLPDVDGFEVLKKILEFDPEAFIVMFSSHYDQENIDRAISCGAKGFVPKPFNKEMLLTCIEGSTSYFKKH